MDKIDKFTRKLRHDIASRVLGELENIRAGNIAHLDVKKLRGSGSVYRVRIGKIRIKFVHLASGIKVIDAGFRNDRTY